jgi:transposase-like protein
MPSITYVKCTSCIEMNDCLGAEPGEMTAGRLGYRAGYCDLGLITRIGKIELRVLSRDIAGKFSTVLF